jgi:hypothetical protein
MFQLIYTSTAARRLDDEDLHALLELARARNERLGVTGMLVYRNGSFLHVLEGDEKTVRALYHTIRRDGRHRCVTLLKATALEGRDFPETPMAFRDCSVTGSRRPSTDRKEWSDATGGPGARKALLQFQPASASRDGSPATNAPRRVFEKSSSPQPDRSGGERADASASEAAAS